MLFSLTRTPLKSEIDYGYNELLTQYNPAYDTGSLFQQLLPRLPLFIATLFCFALVVFKKISISMYLFLAMLVFATFNPIIFPQYNTWVVPLAVIGLLDYIKAEPVPVQKLKSDLCKIR